MGMVEFGSKLGTNYFMPMDREYAGNMDVALSKESPSASSTNDVGVSIGDFGMSIGLGPVPNVQAVGAKLRAGTKTIELGFMGQGKGSGQGHTPEMYGLKQRAALVEMGLANKVDFTTHATVGVYGMAGMDQQGNFSKQGKNVALNEIKRAVDFAADVARGGPVVVHTGEFHRPLVDSEWNKGGKWNNKFRMYEEEEERASYRVVDTRTGALIQEARKNRRVSRPVWNTVNEGGEYIDFDGDRRKAASFRERDGQKIAYDGKGRIIYLDPFGMRVSDEKRVPKFNPEIGEFEMQQMDWEDLVEEAKQMTLRGREVFREWKNASPEKKKELQEASYWKRFLTLQVTDEKQISVRPEEAYIISTLETNAANSRGWAYYYGGDFNEHVENIKKLKEAYKFYEKLENTINPEEKERLKRQEPHQRFGGLIPEDTKYPTEMIKKMLKTEDRQLKQSQEASASQWAQAAEAMETIKHVESAESYAKREAYDSYANAAITAMEQSDRLEKEKKLRMPVQIAMENLFPESYGAHPDELKDLVMGSREKMVELLKKRGMDEEKAKKEAGEHITATFDTGHLNMWKKYWQGDPKKSMAENDAEFRKWTLEKVGELAKANVIGHVHLVDNFGYQDDHLAPGEGNAPVKEIVEMLKKSGFKGKMIVEPGADYNTDVTGFHSVMKTWRLFGSPVYGIGSGISAGRGESWEQVGYRWFGQNQPPYFTFGTYSPSEDWTLWSGVQLE